MRFIWLYVILFFADLALGLIQPTLSLYASSLGASLFLVSVISSTVGVTRIFGQPFFGDLSDRTSRWFVSTIGMVCMVSFAIIIAAGSNPWVILAATPILGISINVFTMASAFIGDKAPRNEIDRVMGWALLSQGTGFGLGPIIAGFTIRYLSFAATYYIAAFFGSIALLVSSVKMGQPRSTRPTDSSAVPAGSILRRIFARVRERDLLSLGGITMFVQFAMLATLTFLPLRAKGLGMDLTTVGAIIGTRTLFSTAIRFVPGRTSSTVGRLNLLLISVVLSGAGVGLMSISYDFQTFTFAGILEGVGYGLYLTISRALMANMTHTSKLGVSMGFLDTFGALGQTVLIFTVGIISQAVGLQIGFASASSFVLVGGLVSFSLLRTVKIAR